MLPERPVSLSSQRTRAGAQPKQEILMTKADKAVGSWLIEVKGNGKAKRGLV